MSDSDPILAPELAGLVEATRPAGIDLVLVGGFGVLLRVVKARKEERETLGHLPATRSTRDLDLMLTAGVIVSADATARLREILEGRGYDSVSGTEHYQFVRVKRLGDFEATIKIDLFAEEPPEGAPVIRKERRIRPKGFNKLHGHRAEEAVAITESPVEVTLAEGITIPTPNLFSYWLLKLFALRDRIDSDEVEEARRHAFDLYALWAATNREQWTAASRVAEEHGDHPCAIEAATVVDKHFRAPSALGRIRLKEAFRSEGGSIDDEVIERFVASLEKLFPLDSLS